MRRGRWMALVGAMALATALPALAQEASDAEPLVLRYEAPAACPDSGAFFGQLRARTGRVRAPKDGEQPRALVVRVAPAGRGFIGHLHFEDAGRSTSPRVVEARSCAEVVEALGLSAALAVDPQASTAPAAALTTAPDAAFNATADAAAGSLASDGGGASAVTASTTPGPAASDLVPTRFSNTPMPMDEPPLERGRDADNARASAMPRSTRFGAGVAVEAAALSGLVPSGRVFLELSLFDRAPLWAPSVRLFAMRSLGVDQSPAAPAVGAASLTWTAGGFDVCPIRVQFASSFALRPCAEMTAGSVFAEASGFAGAKNRGRAWMAVDVHGRLGWEPVRLLAFELEAGALAPLLREEFFFEPSAIVYQAPIIGFFGRLGASVRFP